MADNNELPGTPISEFTEITQPENGLFVIIQKNLSNFKYDLGKFAKGIKDLFNSIETKLIIGTGSDTSVKLGTNPSSSSNDNQVATTKWVNDKGYAAQSSVNDLNTAVQTINSKIPSEASSSNKLADKDFVNSSIATNTATFRGTFTDLNELKAQTGTINDYAFHQVVDATTQETVRYDRYKYVNETPHWVFEYSLNNSSFTASQWAAINSGLSSSDKTTLDFINSLIPSAASPTNKLVDMNYVDTQAGKVDDVLVDGQSVVGEDKKARVDLTEYAKQNGYYEGLTSGHSENFLGKGTSTPAEFIYRTTAGSQSIAEGEADATAVNIYGKTLVFNQLVEQLAIAGTFNGITVTKNSDGSYTFDGTATAELRFYFGISNHSAGRTPKPELGGHKYCLRGCPAGGSLQTYFLSYLNGVDGLMDYEYSADIGNGKIGSIYNNGYTDTGFVIKNGVTVSNLKVYPQFVDLTQMFVTNEPTTVEQFKSMFPLDYYDYDQGSLLNFTGEGIKTNGFNQFNKSTVVQGYIDDSSGNLAPSNTYYASDFIEVLPNTIYYFSGNGNSANWGAWYDCDKKYISGIGSHGNRQYTSPSNARYLRFTIPVQSQLDTACINLSHSGYRNGEYEPYWERTLSLPIAQYFPTGMKSVGNDKDQLTKDKAIQRIKEFRILTATNPAILGNYTRFQVAHGITGLTGYHEGICNRLEYIVSYAQQSEHFYINEESFVIIMKTSDIGSTIEEIKAWLENNPLWIYCGLVTPIETPINPPLNLTYKVDDFGTEQLLPVNSSVPTTTPLNADIRYNLDYEAEVRNMPNNYYNKTQSDAKFEEKSNKVTSISSASTDAQYPSAKLLYDETNKIWQTIGDFDLSFKQVQDIVRLGKAKETFKIGDQLVVKWTDPDNTANSYDMPFDIVHFGKVTDQAGIEHDGLFLQSHYASLFGVQFSNYQAFYYTPDGLPAGTYHITWGNNWGTNVVSGKSYQFTLTQPVPAGGQLSGFYGAPDQAPSNWKVYSWESNTATSPIETVTVAEGTDGTSLGTISSSTKTATLNAMQSMAYGYNRWNESAIEQYLNKSGANWWAPKSNFDRRPDQYTKKAFIGGFPQDFLDAIGTIKVQTSANTLIDGGVTDITYDKFFLPSLEQLYISPQISGIEGDYWEYWKERTGASSPQAQYGTYPERITYALENHASAQSVRLRSAYRGYSYITWYVYSSGYVSNDLAIGAYRCAPACVIY